MKIGSLLGWGAAIGGGYLVLKYLGYDPLSHIVGVGPGTPVNTGGGTTTSPQGSDAANTTASTTLAAIVTAMKNAGTDPAGYYTVDGFNYYYKQVRGVDLPGHEGLFPKDAVGTRYTIAEWWTAVTGQGFSGLGIIAHHVNPYLAAWVQDTPFGANLIPTGFEKFHKRLNQN